METRLLKIDDHDFEVEIHGDTSSPKLALFLHGFPETSYTWSNQMPLFVKRGYQCWAPNQRGYGNSFSPQEIEAYKMRHLTQDVAKLIDASACKETVLIGHDWGGAVAWRFAIQNLRPLNKLIILNVPHPAVLAREMKQWRQLKKFWYFFFFQIPKLPEYSLTRNHAEKIKDIFTKSFINQSQVTSELLERYSQNALREGGMQAMLNWYRAAFRFPDHTNRSIDTPTLLVWGEKDLALNIHCSEGTEKYVKDITLRRLPNVGHFVHEDDPAQTNQIIQSWLDQYA